MDNTQYMHPSHLRETLAKRLNAVEMQMQALQAEQHQLREDLHLAEEFLTLWRRVNNVAGPAEQPRKAYEVRSDVPAPARKPRNPSREKVVDTALELISAAGRPLVRQELYEGLKVRGVEVYGKDPQMVLSTMLWRSQDRIVRLGSYGYWFKDRPFAAAEYEPSIDDLMGVATPEPEGELEDPEDDTEVASEDER